MRSPSLVSSASLVSSSGASSDTEEKVPLGDGVFCSKAAYSKLINVEESHADWAYALLKGVFGDKAHRMRVRISRKCSENEKFSPNFLMVAKFLHRDWLIKQTIRDNSGQLHSKYSPAEVEKYVNALPAYLADRAYDMQGGPRGANVRNAPERRRSESTAPKRNYKRRGQPLSSQQLPQQSSHHDPISSEPSSLQQYQHVDNLQSQQQLPQQSSHHDPISTEPSSLQQYQHGDNLQSQQQLPQQSSYHNPISSELSLQQYQDVDNLQSCYLIPPPTSEAEPMGFQHVETTATTFTNL